MVYVGGFPPEFPFRFPMNNLPACAYAIGYRFQPIFPRPTAWPRRAAAHIRSSRTYRPRALEIRCYSARSSYET